MKITAIAAGLVLATAAATASAQVYYERPNYGTRTAPDSNSECWNPRAGHFEQVRPGEVQNDLDFARCRSFGGRYYDNGRNYDNGRYSERRYEGMRQECWNPRAGHYEEVRTGEAQNDLDFGRCRVSR